VFEPKILTALRKLEEAVERLEKAAGKTILGRQKRGTQYWTSEIRKPGLEGAYATATIAASPDSPYYEWWVTVVTGDKEFLAYQGATEKLEDAKKAVEWRVKNLHIWQEGSDLDPSLDTVEVGKEMEEIKGSDLVWNPPLDTVEKEMKKIMGGYRRWGVRFPDDRQGVYRALVVVDERKKEIRIVDPIKRKTYSVRKLEKPVEEEIKKIKEELTRRFGREVVLEEILLPGAEEASAAL
jgi:hypothetical protein